MKVTVYLIKTVIEPNSNPLLLIEDLDYEWLKSKLTSMFPAQNPAQDLRSIPNVVTSGQGLVQCWGIDVVDIVVEVGRLDGNLWMGGEGMERRRRRSMRRGMRGLR